MAAPRRCSTRRRTRRRRRRRASSELLNRRAFPNYHPPLPQSPPTPPTPPHPPSPPLHPICPRQSSNQQLSSSPPHTLPNPFSTGPPPLSFPSRRSVSPSPRPTPHPTPPRVGGRTRDPRVSQMAGPPHNFCELIEILMNGIVSSIPGRCRHGHNGVEGRWRCSNLRGGEKAGGFLRFGIEFCSTLAQP